MNGSANNSDYAALSGLVVNFGKNGSKQKSIFVKITGDKIVEQDETFSLNLSNPVNATLGDKTGVGVIKNNDSSQLVLTGGGSKVEQDSGEVAYNYQMKLSNPVQGGFSISYQTKDGSAKQTDADFSNGSGKLSFNGSAGQTKSFTINAKGDNKVEGDETFSVDFSSSAPAGVELVNNSTTSTILNDDKATITLNGSQIQNEGDSGLKGFQFTVSVDNPVAGGFDVNYEVQGDSATADDDFESNNGALSFFGGQNEVKTITVQVIGDGKIEEDEMFYVKLLSLSNTPFADDVSIISAEQSGTINNDDFATLTLSGGVAKDEGNFGPTAYTFEVALFGDVEDGLNVAYSVNDESAQASDNDYVDNDGILLFDGETGEVQTITVIVNGDTKAEAHEQFNVTLDAVTSGGEPVAVQFIDSPQIGTITNDDGAVFFLDVGDGFATEFDGTMPVSITLSTLSDIGATVDYTVVAATAKPGEDYTAVSGTATFGPGEVVKVIQVPIIDDEELENEESFTFVLSNPSNFELGEPASSVITILDNDSTPIVNMVAPLVQGLESDEFVSFDVVLSQPFGLPVRAVLDWDEGTASDGVDFKKNTEEIMFKPGQAVHTIEIPILADDVYERNEDLTVRLSEAENGTLGENTETLIKIIEDDPAPTITISDVTFNEALAGVSIMNFELQLSHYAAIDIFIDFETAPVSAEPEQDYVDVSGRLRIRAGSLTGTIGVPILSDSLDENDETFELSLINNSEGAFDSPSGALTVVGTIKNVNALKFYLPIASK